MESENKDTGVDRDSEASARRLRMAIIALGMALIVLLVFFGISYRNLRRSAAMNQHRSFMAALSRHHAPLTAEQADVIQSWMTFDYVGRLFALPPEYLKTALQVQDVRYPAISLGHYAGEINENGTDFSLRVIAAVRNYLLMSTSSPANATGMSSSSAPK